MTDTRPRLLLVHGAWVGAWEFADLVAVLRARGWRVDTVELPSTGSTGGLPADADAVRAAIGSAAGEVVLVAHSYGGIPVTQLGHHDRVARIVYVAAFAIDEGESLRSSLGGELPAFWHVAGDQVTLGPDRGARVAMVAADLPPDAPAGTAEAIADLFRPQSLSSFTDAVTEVAWRTTPSSYILTEQDALVPPGLQERLAARAGSDVVRLARGHVPFQEAPAEFADLLEQIVLGG